MTKYELSLTKDYVPGWTIVDAMRELFQNALDQQTTTPDNEMFWDYDEKEQKFYIGNKSSVLEPKSLLLGASSKANDKNTIGQFGEGYKVATLVLLRNGKTVTFYNYGAKEVWRARFSKSRKYGTDILVFEVDKKFMWQSVPDNNLTIEIGNITFEESLWIGEHNLHMQEAYKYWQTPFGRILVEEDLKGKMFVNGLYICDNKEFHYGYSFNPDQVRLDRDRKLINDFDLKWKTSQMWVGFRDEDNEWDYDAIDAASSLIQEGAPDTEYVKEANSHTNAPRLMAVKEHVVGSFKEKYGDNAVPVSTQEEIESVPDTHKAVIVNETFKKVVTSSPEYVAPASVVKPSLRQRVEEWLEKHGNNLTSVQVAELELILEDYE